MIDELSDAMHVEQSKKLRLWPNANNFAQRLAALRWILHFDFFFILFGNAALSPLPFHRKHGFSQDNFSDSGVGAKTVSGAVAVF